MKYILAFLLFLVSTNAFAQLGSQGIGTRGLSGGGGGSYFPGYDVTAAIDCEFTLGQCYDKTTNTLVAPSTLLTDTRSGTIPYDPGTSITTTVAANTLPIGSAGLQLFQVNNMLGQTNGDYTVAGAIWNSVHTTIAAPTVTKNPNFGSSGCSAATTAPDGSCNTTEVTIPPGTSTSVASVLQQHVTPVTGNVTYTCFVWVKNKTLGTEPQFYLSTQLGASPNTEFANSFVQAGDTWKRFSLTFLLPTIQTAYYLNIGNGNGVSTNPTAPESIAQPGGTFELWVSGCSPGPAPAPFLITPTTASPTIALDSIVTTGHLSTALGASAGALSITIAGGGTTVAGTMLDDNGTVFLGKSSTDNGTTALGATLSSPDAGTFTKSTTTYLAWSGTIGAINLNNTAASTDSTARTPGAGPFHIGTTSGTTAPLDAYITSLKVYSTPATPFVASSVPITSITFGTIATLSSGTLQGGPPATFVNGDSWAPTVDPAGNIWSFCDDCGYGAFQGNAMLVEPTWSGGNYGYYNLGTTTWTGGSAGRVNTFATALGTETQVQAGTHNTWKSRGLVGIQDGANVDLIGGLDADIYWAAPVVPVGIQLRLNGGSIISVVNPAAVSPLGASVTANWAGMPPTPPVLPATTPTFASTQFGAPGFVQYPAGTYCTGSLDGSGSFVYAVSNDLAYNTGSNAYLARIACSTILTSLGGSPAAASTPTSWQFYDTANGGCTGTGLDPNCWTSTLANATPIFTYPNKLGVVGMDYLPVNNRYLLTSFYNPPLNGATANTETQTQMASTTNFVFADCDKPWHCTAALPELHWPRTAYYDPAVIMSSLVTDGGLTGTMIFTGNFTGSQAFTSAAVYTPNMGQMIVRY